MKHVAVLAFMWGGPSPCDPHVYGRYQGRASAQSRGRLASPRLKILPPEFDRHSVRRPIGSMVPRAGIAGQDVRRGHSLLRDDTLERGEPVAVVAVAGVGTAGCLRLADLLPKRPGPLLPAEKPALLQRQRHGERARLPRLPEDRAASITQQTRIDLGSEEHRLGTVAHVK